MGEGKKGGKQMDDNDDEALTQSKPRGDRAMFGTRTCLIKNH